MVRQVPKKAERTWSTRVHQLRSRCFLDTILLLSLCLCLTGINKALESRCRVERRCRCRWDIVSRYGR